MKAKTTWHRLLSTLLCLVMVMGLLPTVAFAEGTLPTPKNLTWDGSKAKWEYTTTGTANVDNATVKLYNTKYSDAVIQLGFQRYSDFTEWNVSKYLLPGDTYKFEVIVKERDASNTTSAMSDTYTMSSGTFTPTAVTNLQLGADGVMKWNEVPYATEYAAKLFEYRDSRWFCVDEAKISGTTNTYTYRWLENNFTPDVQYKAKLEARQGTLTVGTAAESNVYTHTGTVHTHTADETVWKKDAFYHWHACACGQLDYASMALHSFGADDVCTVCGRRQFSNPNNIFPQPQNLRWDGTTAKWELPDGIRLKDASFYVWNVKSTKNENDRMVTGYASTGGCGSDRYVDTELDQSNKLIPGETYFFEIKIGGYKNENINGGSYAISETMTVPGTYTLQTIEDLNLGKNGYMTWTPIERYNASYFYALYRIEEDDSLTLLAKLPRDWQKDHCYWGADLFEDGKTYIASIVAKEGTYLPLSHVAYSNEYIHNGTGDTYAVTFRGGEGATGTAPTMENQPFGASFKLPANPFVKDGSEFRGWNDGTTTYPAGYIYAMPDRAVTFTAQWSGTDVHTCAPELVPQKAATCKEAGNAAYYKCECGNLYTDAAGTSPTTLEAVTIARNPDNHAGTKTLEHNETQHWYAWDCCHALDGEKTDHTPGDWIIDTPATAATEGAQHKACTVCGFTTHREVIPAAGYTITFDANGGTCGTASAATGTDGKLAALPTPARSGGYRFLGWFTQKTDGTEITTDTKFTEDSIIYAQWKYVGGHAGPAYSIDTPKTANGSVTVSPGSAAAGTTVTITVIPDKGCELDTLRVTDKDGRPVRLTGKDGRYTFEMPASRVTVQAAFRKIAIVNPFVDVKAGDYFYDAVLWAVEKDITSGTSAVTFSPNASCTRAQIVTFLWRAAGSPEPKSTAGFSDVAADAYYAKAVAWAVEQGITKGTSDTTFSPDDVCTRAQAVTFLSRALKGKAAAGSTFSDVPADSCYAEAVAWAVEQGITKGTSATTFSPHAACTRGQIVTFLFRAMAE